MAKRTVVDCDHCGKECKTPIEIAIPNGLHKYNDGVENCTDYLYEKKDLCPGCVAGLLHFMFDHKKVVTTKDDASDPYGCSTKVNAEWKRGKYIHAGAEDNDAIALALKFFGIKAKT